MLKTYDKNNISELYNVLKNRKETSLNEVAQSVAEIVDDVKINGDKAVKAYIKKFDGIDVEPEDFFMSESEIDEIYDKCDREIIRVMEIAAEKRGY
jgi:histidinol dehydrogenase